MNSELAKHLSGPWAFENSACSYDTGLQLQARNEYALNLMVKITHDVHSWAKLAEKKGDARYYYCCYRRRGPCKD